MGASIFNHGGVGLAAVPALTRETLPGRIGVDDLVERAGIDRIGDDRRDQDSGQFQGLVSIRDRASHDLAGAVPSDHCHWPRPATPEEPEHTQRRVSPRRL